MIFSIRPPPILILVIYCYSICYWGFSCCFGWTPERLSIFSVT